MDNMKPLVSIIVACYNCEDYLDKCMKSLLCQTYKNIEIVICDDASTDNSYAILEKYALEDSRVRLLRNEQGLRAAASRNRCLEICQGDYVVIQDADDFSELDRVEKLLNVLESNDKIDFVSSAAFHFSISETQVDCVQKIKKEAPIARDFLWGLPFIHAATMFTRTCIKGVDGYRVAEETRRGQDYDMFMRMYATGYRGINISEPLYWIRTDKEFYQRRVTSSAKDEYKVRVYGFKKLELMPIGYLFACKPYIAELLHRLRYLLRKRDKI